jgi:hypothetical protein
MRRQAPLVLCFVFGIVMMLIEFSPHPISQRLREEVVNWALIIGPFALLLGVGTLLRVHWTRIQRRAEYWRYSFLVFIGMALMLVFGLPFGPNYSVFAWLFNHVQAPMEATMFSLLAFFIASASYRAFRARTLEATLLLIAALIVMIGNAPVGDLLWNRIMPFAENFPSTSRQWILDNPNLSSRRGIILGVSLGVISQSIRIILGIERSYLGGGN